MRNGASEAGLPTGEDPAREVSAGPARSTVDMAEIARFSAVADRFWDPEGPYRPLHRLNPVRLAFVRDQLARRFGRPMATRRPFQEMELLDVGCGGGLVAEPMNRLGFAVTAIDAAPANIEAARAHAAEDGIDIDYRVASAEDLLAQGKAGPFDVVLALEVVEHVADLDAFGAALGQLVRPGGALVLSTLNRTARSFLLGIVAAEHVLRWVPRGTHQWRRFLKPSELGAVLRPYGLEIEALSGVEYDGSRDGWKLTRDVGVNYMAVLGKSG